MGYHGTITHVRLLNNIPRLDTTGVLDVVRVVVVVDRHHITCASGPPSMKARSTRWRATRSLLRFTGALFA